MVRPDEQVGLDAADLGLRAVRRGDLDGHIAVCAADALRVNRRTLALTRINRRLSGEERLSVDKGDLACGLLVVIGDSEHITFAVDRYIVVLAACIKLEDDLATSVEKLVVKNLHDDVGSADPALLKLKLDRLEFETGFAFAVVERRCLLVKRNIDGDAA